MTERPGVPDQDAPRASPTTEPVRAQAHSPRCPECACAELALLREGEIVSVYKCSKCGHLIAPVKRP